MNWYVYYGFLGSYGELGCLGSYGEYHGTVVMQLGFGCRMGLERVLVNSNGVDVEGGLLGGWRSGVEFLGRWVASGLKLLLGFGWLHVGEEV